MVSYGVSSYGYDCRFGNEFKVSPTVYNHVWTRKLRPESFVTSPVTVHRAANSCVGLTVEYFRIPRDVLTVCLGNVTYARCGIIVNVTPLSQSGRPRHDEISNTTPLPAKIYAKRHRTGVVLPERRAVRDLIQAKV